jgi:phosphate transport system permease protein
VLLALARGAGETAPLLFTMTFSDYWLSRHLMEPTSPFENQKQFAWAASLVLVFIVWVFTLGGQLLSRRAAKLSGALHS